MNMYKNYSSQECKYGIVCYDSSERHNNLYTHKFCSGYHENRKPECIFGYGCYRTNSEHLAEFRHPKYRNIYCKKCDVNTARRIIHANSGLEIPLWLCIRCR